MFYVFPFFNGPLSQKKSFKNVCYSTTKVYILCFNQNLSYFRAIKKIFKKFIICTQINLFFLQLCIKSKLKELQGRKVVAQN